MRTVRGADKAVVVGASMAGLLTAAVLADRFAEVAVVDRDDLPPDPVTRKGVPQGHHVHALGARGAEILTEIFPGIMEDLEADGAGFVDPGSNICWYQAGGWVAPFTSDANFLCATRPLIEHHTRRRLSEIESVEILDRRSFDRFLLEGDSVAGIAGTDRTDGSTFEIRADLTVDASGRNSLTPDFLADNGFGRPPVTEISVDITYATRLWHRDPSDVLPAAYMVHADPPEQPRAAFVFPIEGNRWLSTLIGWGGDRPPRDLDGYLEFAHSLPMTQLASKLETLQPASEPHRYRFPSNRRVHYEKLKRFPGGLAVVGDALASYNPAYGQGMSAAALHAVELGAATDEGLGGALPRRFLRKAARVTDRPWAIASGADFRFTTTTGPKRSGTDVVNRYIGRVTRGMNVDPALAIAFGDVIVMRRSPASLLRPSTAWRALRSGGRTRQETRWT